MVTCRLFGRLVRVECGRTRLGPAGHHRERADLSLLQFSHRARLQAPRRVWHVLALAARREERVDLLFDGAVVRFYITRPANARPGACVRADAAGGVVQRCTRADRAT